MDETGSYGDRPNLPIRPGTGGGRIGPSGPRQRADRAFAGPQRIPTVRELAALLVNGILTLPRHYRRGMFLDVIV